MEEQRHYDAIVIGSGIGGLAAASTLAKLAGRRVLVLERHYVLGGLSQVFKRRDGRRWDVGVHYVGDLYEGSLARGLFDFLSDGALCWQRISEPFERFIYPDFTFEVYGDERRYRNDLTRAFPAERVALGRYFRDMKRAAAWWLRRFIGRQLPGPLAPSLRMAGAASGDLALELTRDYLDRSFRDPRLRSLLASQWRDHGLTPDRSAFLTHAVIATHYLNGGWYPIGGGSAIADALVPAIEAAGGACLDRHEVERISVENGRAVGVEAICTRGGRAVRQRFTAPAILSDAGARTTYGRLLPAGWGAAASERIEALGPPPTGVMVYLGFRRSPAELGFRGANYWICEDYEHDGAREGEAALGGRPSGCYLSFPSLKDPASQVHTAEVLQILSYEAFAAWSQRPWQRRGDDYERLKARIAEGVLDLLERHFPGFRDLVDYWEVSTPLSVESFTGSPGGAIYGLPGTPDRFREAWLGVDGPLAGLYLAGSDAYIHGVFGAALGGLAAAGAALGSTGFLRALAAVRSDAAQRSAQSPALERPGRG